METKAVALDAAAPAPPAAVAAELLDAVVLPTGVPLGGDLIACRARWAGRWPPVCPRRPWQMTGSARSG